MLKTIILKKFNLIPETMIVLGSGINKFIENLEDSESIGYKELFNYDTDESIGHSGMLHIGYIQSKPMLLLEGRKHYYEEVSDSDMRQMIQSFARIGVKNIVLTNACGAMNETFKPGDIMLIEDHINMMGRNPLVGINAHELGPRFPDMSEPYDLEFRTIIESVSKEKCIDIQKGIYVSYLGPSYETKAEIRAFRMLGGDVVGMSTVPEVLIARHASMRVLGLSLITNMSTGVTKYKLNHQEVLDVGKKSVNKLSTLILGFLERI